MITLTDREWLAGKGGTDTLAVLPDVDGFWQLTPAQQEEFRRGAYILAIEVVMAGNAAARTIYIDPQGYKYARYVGFVAPGITADPARFVQEYF